MTLRRVAVTGLGVVAPQGNSVEEFWANLIAGRSGVHRLPSSISHGLRSPIGASANFEGKNYFEPPRLRMLDRVSQLALVAAQQAIVDSRLNLAAESRERCGVFVGTGMGGAETTEEGYHTLYAQRSDRIKPYSVVNAMANAPGRLDRHRLRTPGAYVDLLNGLFVLQQLQLAKRGGGYNTAMST